MAGLTSSACLNIALLQNIKIHSVSRKWHKLRCELTLHFLLLCQAKAHNWQNKNTTTYEGSTVIHSKAISEWM